MEADCIGPVVCSTSLDCIPGGTENYWKSRERSNMTTVVAGLRTDHRGIRVEESTEEGIAIFKV